MAARKIWLDCMLYFLLLAAMLLPWVLVFSDITPSDVNTSVEANHVLIEANQQLIKSNTLLLEQIQREHDSQ